MQILVEAYLFPKTENLKLVANMRLDLMSFLMTSFYMLGMVMNLQ